MNPRAFKALIKERAAEHGFSDVRVLKAALLEEESIRLKQWLEDGRHGTMQYLENHFDKRTDPRKLVEGTKSILVFSYNYFPENQLLSTRKKMKIARYAYGRDYHKIIRKKLKALLSELQVQMPSLEGRGFVDSAPVLERDLARRSGLGWTGKNTLTIHPRKGSYFFISSLFINYELPQDEPIRDYCGTCRRCIEACPTKAIDDQGYLMDGSKCISYLTIENKSEMIDPEFHGKMEGWIYGCDICQEVCPWNRFSTVHNETRFQPKAELLGMTEKNWQELDEINFDTIFQGSAVKRAKFKGLRRNINFILDHD